MASTTAWFFNNLSVVPLDIEVLLRQNNISDDITNEILQKLLKLEE